MESHNFIKFPPNLGELSPRTWLLLGEIQSKIEQIKTIPIPPDDSDWLRGIYLAKGVHSTTAIEGNSFSEAEVAQIIAGEMEAPPSLAYQEQQIDNMLAAFNTVGKNLLSGGTLNFSPQLLHSYHRLVLAELEASLTNGVVIGDFRQDRVGVWRYLAAPPAEVPALMGQYCDWLNDNPASTPGYELAGKIIKAIVAHVYFAWIHPYGDGNGRMARLIEYMILLGAGVPDIPAHLLSNFYNKTRERYYRRLQESHGEFSEDSYPDEGHLQPFIEYALEGYRDELNEQLSYIYARQVKVIWHDFIHSSFPKTPTAVQQRRKRLALDLTDRGLEQPLTIADIRELTAAIALSYQGKTNHTIQRDLDQLVEMKLLKREAKGYQPNTDILRAFFANTRSERD